MGPLEPRDLRRTWERPGTASRLRTRSLPSPAFYRPISPAKRRDLHFWIGSAISSPYRVDQFPDCRFDSIRQEILSSSWCLGMESDLFLGRNPCGIAIFLLYFCFLDDFFGVFLWIYWRMFFSGDASTRRRVDLGGRSSKERDRQMLLEQTRLERKRRLGLRQQSNAAIKIQVSMWLFLRELFVFDAEYAHLM